MVLSPDRTLITRYSDSPDILATATLPARLKWFVASLYGYGVVDQCRFVDDQIHFWLPSHYAGSRMLPAQMLDLFCQAVAQILQQPEIEPTWDTNRTIDYARGVGFDLGTAGAWLAQMMDWACSE